MSGPTVREVRTRETNTGEPCSYRYSNGLLAEPKIQTICEQNTRRRTIKTYAGIATLAFARKPSAKARKVEKQCSGHFGDWTCFLACVRRVPYIYGINNNALKGANYDLPPLTFTFMNSGVISTAGLPVSYTWGRRHNFCCRDPILITRRPVLESLSQTTRDNVLDFFCKT